MDGTDNGGTDCNKNPVGIFYRNASGTVQDVAVRNMRLGPGLEGCQGGQGVFVQSGLAGSSSVSVLRSIHGYQKNGITGNEVGTTLTARDNRVTGLGPTPFIAQNGIQIGFGAAAGIEGTGNTIRNNRINEAPIGIWNFSGTNTIPPPPPGLRNSFFNVGVAIHSGMTPPVIARLLREAGAQLAARVAGPSPIR